MLLCILSREYQLTDFSRRCICLMQRRFPKGNVTLCLKEMMVGIAGNTLQVEKASSISLSLEALPLSPPFTTQGRHKIRESQRQRGRSLLLSGNVSMEELLHFIYCPLHLLDFFFPCSSCCFLCCLNLSGKGNFGRYLRKEFNLTQARTE